MVKVRAVDPNASTGPLLAGAQFSDAYSIAIDDALDARHAAERMLGRSPPWVEALLSLRHRLVAPFGLKTRAPKESCADIIALFPGVSQTPDRLVSRFNDKHLDFLLVAYVATADQVQSFTTR